jgi:type II secretory pathway component PulF
MAFEISQTQPPQDAAAPPPRFGFQLRLPAFSRTIGVEQRMAFTEQLALLLDTGVSIHEALNALKHQTVDTQFAAILQSLFDQVTEGKPLSLALSRHPEMFSQSYVSLVAAAEEGGFLQQVLKQLLEIDEKNSRLRSTITSALAYPVFLILFSIAVVVFVLVVVFPKFADLFQSIRGELPYTTLALMALSDFLTRHWLLSLLALAGAAAGVLAWLNSRVGEALIDALKLRIPLVGDIFMQVYLNQTLNVIGLALVSGVPATTALKAAQDVIRNRNFARFVETVRNEVNEGRGMASGFAKAAFIPPMVREMVATGERSGQLGKVMMRVADFYGRELNRRIALLARIAEPFMLLVMGVVVGLLVASLVLPIFKLSKGLH